jgi:hypothetical protein
MTKTCYPSVCQGKECIIRKLRRIGSNHLELVIVRTASSEEFYIEKGSAFDCNLTAAYDEKIACPVNRSVLGRQRLNGGSVLPSSSNGRAERGQTCELKN